MAAVLLKCGDISPSGLRWGWGGGGEKERKARCLLSFPVGVFGSRHPLLPHLPFSFPSLLSPPLFSSISHEDVMFDLVV